jgi:translation initiation factor IF-2
MFLMQMPALLPLEPGPSGAADGGSEGREPGVKPEGVKPEGVKPGVKPEGGAAGPGPSSSGAGASAGPARRPGGRVSSPPPGQGAARGWRDVAGGLAADG